MTRAQRDPFDDTWRDDSLRAWTAIALLVTAAAFALGFVVARMFL